jgi:nucleoside-diphosphate-sugar epimerase
MTSMSKSFTDKLASLLVIGVDGFIGAAIVRQLEKAGYEHIRTDALMDVRNQSSVNAFFEKEKPEYVFLTTPKNIGSPLYVHKKADFIQDHLMMQNNVMHAAHLYGVFLMEYHDECEIVNVDSGFNSYTKYLANFLAEVIGYDGTICFGVSAEKEAAGLILASSKLNIMGWNATTNLEKGILQIISDDPIF